MRTGNPDCNVEMVDTVHPLRIGLLQWDSCKSGRRQYPPNTNLWRASNRDRERDLLGSIGLIEFSKLEAVSIDLLHVYEARNCTPCEKCLLTCIWSELYAELAIGAMPKTLLKTATPSGGHPAPVVGSHSGDEYLRKPTKIGRASCRERGEHEVA